MAQEGRRSAAWRGCPVGLSIGPLPAGTGLGMAIFSSQMRDGGTRCSSCYKESFQYSSLPRTCACTHTDMPMHTALMQIRERMHRHVSHTETCIWVCTHSYAQRHTPTYLQTCVQYSGVHKLAHTHLIQARPNTQRPAPQVPQVYTRVHRPVEDHQLRKHPQNPVCTQTLSSLQTFHHWLAHGAPSPAAMLVNRPQPHSG